MAIEITPNNQRKIIHDTSDKVVIQYNHDGVNTFRTENCGTSVFKNNRFSWYLKRNHDCFSKYQLYINSLLCNPAHNQIYHKINTILHINKHQILDCDRKIIAWTHHPQGGKTRFTYNICNLCIENGYYPIVMTSNITLLLNKMIADFQSFDYSTKYNTFEMRRLEASIKKLQKHNIGVCLANQSKLKMVSKIIERLGELNVVIIRDEADEDKTLDSHIAEIYNEFHANQKLIQVDITSTPHDAVVHDRRNYDSQINIPLPKSHAHFGQFPMMTIPLDSCITYPINDDAYESFNMLHNSMNGFAGTPLALVYCNYQNEIQRQLAEWFAGKYGMGCMTLNQKGNILYYPNGRKKLKTNLQMAIEQACLACPQGVAIMGNRKFDRGLTFRDPKHLYKPTHMMACLSQNITHLLADIIQLFGRMNGIYNTSIEYPTLLLNLKDQELLKLVYTNKNILDYCLSTYPTSSTTLKQKYSGISLKHNSRFRNINVNILDSKFKRTSGKYTGPVSEDKVPVGAVCLTKIVGKYDVTHLNPGQYRKFVNEKLQAMDLPTFKKSFHYVLNEQRYDSVYKKHPLKYLNGIRQGGHSLSNYIYSIDNNILTIIQRLEDYLDENIIYSWHDADNKYFWGKFSDNYETFNY